MDILIDFVGNFLTERNEDDVFDRLNYQITPFLFVIFSLVNISKVCQIVCNFCFKYQNLGLHRRRHKLLRKSRVQKRLDTVRARLLFN